MIELRGLEYRYPRSDALLLDGMDAAIEPGTVTALVGQSGKGKSTLLYLIGLLLRPAGGDIVIDGAATRELTDPERSRLRNRSIGFVFQDAALDAGRTLLDNVAEPALYAGVPRPVAHRRAQELLDRFGVDIPGRRRPGQISGGQAQRVGICRALMNDPPVILADEPTGNLDPANRDNVLDAFAHERDAGKTILIATHDDAVAAVADRVIRL